MRDAGANSIDGNHDEPAQALTIIDDQELHENGRERPDTSAPIGCPRCGRELEHGPYGTWVCWRCPEQVIISRDDT